ncbi:MAG TPA: hypothetical protein EYP16_03565 [Candidatus Atribacteria bacterium]|nr:hypothetical protein [Candidatus Atribacteria bacterium]
MRIKGYPKNSDIRKAIYKAFREGLVWKPEELYEAVLKELEGMGMKTRYVTEKRVWRTYEMMVQKKWIPDWLNVLKLKR